LEIHGIAGCNFTAKNTYISKAPAITGDIASDSEWTRRYMSDQNDLADGPPEKAKHFSGRVLVRMPASLHGELVAAAASEGVSLNQFISALLASGVQWRRAAERHTEEPDDSRLEGSDRVSDAEYSRIWRDIFR
jgi:predicted HicB family RNase H-like nuclease